MIGLLNQSIEDQNDITALGWLAYAFDKKVELPLQLLSKTVKLGRSVVVFEWARLFPEQVMQLSAEDLIGVENSDVVVGLLQAPVNVEQVVFLRGSPLPLGTAWAFKFPLLADMLDQRRFQEGDLSAAQERYQKIVEQITQINVSLIPNARPSAPAPSITPLKVAPAPVVSEPVAKSQGSQSIDVAPPPPTSPMMVAVTQSVQSPTSPRKNETITLAPPNTDKIDTDKLVAPIFDKIEIHNDFISEMQQPIYKNK